MGLDMNVYRIHKSSLDPAVIYDSNDIQGIILSEEDIEHPMYRQLVPYCEKVRAVKHYYDLEKIKRDYGLDSAHIGGWSCGPAGSIVTIQGKKGEQTVRYELTDELIDREYTIDREETCYVCEREEEVRYWRKAYDVQDWFHDKIGEPVENTGYYILSAELLKQFNERFPEDSLPVEEPNEQYAYFYWEWY